MANKQYTLGKGKLYFDPFISASVKTKTGERYFGNTPSLSLTIESESLDHYDSDGGVRTKDDSVLLQLNRTGAFVTDNIDVENVALFMLGSSSLLSQAALSAQTYSVSDVIKGRFYQIGSTTANPPGQRSLTSFVLKKGATVLVLGTDYTVDLELGRVEILETSVTVLNGDDLTAEYDVSAKTRSRIITASNATIDGALRFVATNPKGALLDYYMPYVRLSPNGEYALKGEEWQQIGFTIDVQKLSDSVESIYIDGRPYTP
jgi:hypothetical protein